MTGSCYVINVFGCLASVSTRKMRAEMAIAKIVLGLVVLWVLAWTPYAVVTLLGISGNGNLLTPLSTLIPAMFAKISACINPFVYSLTHPKIKKELYLRLRCLNGSTSTINSMTDSPIVHFKSRSYMHKSEMDKDEPDINERVCPFSLI